MTKLKIVNQDELKDWAKEIFKKNSFNMVDVSSKKETFRRALASGKIYVGKEVFNKIKNKEMPKGDPMTLAEVSAVLGVKKTSELIPLCHNIGIENIDITIKTNSKNCSLKINAKVKNTGKTGVEMEALTAVSISALTIYDMCKSIDKSIIIENIRLISQKRGKSDFKVKKTRESLPK